MQRKINIKMMDRILNSLNENDNWITPPYVYDSLNEEFNFNFDPCPYRHCLDTWNGLEIEWGERNFVNPPYSKILKECFIHKAIEEKNKEKLCVMLLPVSTSTKIFHDFILPNAKIIRFIRGRIKFEGNKFAGGTGKRDSMIVIFDGRIN